MSKYYATGTKQFVSNEVGEDGKVTKVSRTAGVVIDLDPYNHGLSHAQAMSEANRIAKKDSVTLDGYGVRVVQGTQRGGDIMTKNARERKRQRGLEGRRK